MAWNVNHINQSKTSKKGEVEAEGKRWESFMVSCRNIPEELSHRTHAENYVQVVPDSFYEVAEQGFRSLLHIVSFGSLCQGVANLEVEQEQVLTHAPSYVFNLNFNYL